MTHTAQNIYDAFNDRGFSKFYLLTITDKAFENLLGVAIDEYTDYRIGDDIGYGELIGFLVAKPPLYQELGENGLEVLFMIDNNYEGIHVGTVVGDRWYDAEMDEIIDIISH